MFHIFICYAANDIHLIAELDLLIPAVRRQDNFLATPV